MINSFLSIFIQNNKIMKKLKNKSEALSKHFIVSLIQDDLIHAKLTNGLENLGLNPENYSLQLSATIMDLMGFEGTHSEYMLTYYMDLLKRGTYVDNTQDNKAIKTLAREIYHHLQLQRPLEV